MKTFVSILLALILVCMAVSSIAEGTFVVTDPNPNALEEDYAGDWVCAYAGHDKNVFDAESHLSDLGIPVCKFIYYAEMIDSEKDFHGIGIILHPIFKPLFCFCIGC